jgi:alditol oxidase
VSALNGGRELARSDGAVLRNWAGNHTYVAERVHRPHDVSELREIVAGLERVHAVGTRHSFTDLADTSGDLISTQGLPADVEIDAERRVVRVASGVRYGRLAEHLARRDWALAAMASLPHISVAGAVATGTHGSGDRTGSLASAVAAVELVVPDGGLRRVERGDHEFEGHVVPLGALGVVTHLELDIEPMYAVRQDVYTDLAWDVAVEHLDELTGSAYSVSLFTDWRDARFNQVWLKRRVTDGASSELEPGLFGATLATSHRHPIASLSAENCTEQMGNHGPWHERLPHFRMDYTPSSGEELQTEYLVPRQHAFVAFRALDLLREHMAPLLQISEVRTIAADNLWMSPCYKQACVSIHFTWKKDWHSVRQLLPMLEEQLAPLGARPHWGKLFTMTPTRLQSLYEKLPDFQQLLRHYDPKGKFRNAFLDTYIFGAH